MELGSDICHRQNFLFWFVLFFVVKFQVLETKYVFSMSKVITSVGQLSRLKLGVATSK